MPETTEVKRAQEVLNAEIESLKSHASTSVNPCDVAKLIAVMDKSVLDVLMRHIAQGDQPRGVACIGNGRVLFAFGCPPNTICLVPRDVLVIVDLVKKQVIEIVDPYDALGLSHLSNERSNATTFVRVPSARAFVARDRIANQGVRSFAAVMGAGAPQLHSSGMSMAGDSFSATITVADMPFKEVLSGNDVFPFNGDSLVLTLPTAGTYRFFLRVNDGTHPNKAYSYTVVTSTGSTLTRSSSLDGNGDNTVGIEVEVP